MEVKKTTFNLDDRLKELEEKNELLMQQVSYLTNIIALLPGNVYWKDRNGYYQGCNKNLARILGLRSPKEIVGKTAFDLTDPDNAKCIQNIDKSIMDKNEEYIVEEVGYNDEGEQAYYLTRKVPLRDHSGHLIGLAGISLDVTEHKQAEARERAALAEAQEAKVKAKAEEELRQIIHVLAGSIVHDLRTPIATLSITSKNLKNILDKLLSIYKQNQENNKIEPTLSLSPKELTCAETVANQLKSITEQMNHFIDVTLKSMSKGLIGEFNENDLVQCSIIKCVHKAIHSFPFESEYRKRVHSQLAKDFIFLGDEILIMRILLNLIKNALEQIKLKGKGELFFSIEEDSEHNFLCIKDTAGSVTQEIIDRLFSPYQSQKENGAGIGLAFGKIAMQSLGGDMTCHLVDGNCIEFRLGFLKQKLNKF